MSKSIRSRVLKIPKRENEIHLIEKSKAYLENEKRQCLISDDYQAPITAFHLRPNSRWLIVRRNLHRIRFMGYNERGRDSAVPNLYLGFQMKRELKRAQEEIKNIDKEEHFHAIKQFALAIDSKRIKTYDTSHVKPNDALVYDRLGEEPLALQNLLYYFSKQDVGHGTLFWDFLNEVNRVLHMKRKRTVRVQRLRRLALTLALIFYVLIGFMLLALIISVATTAAKLNDPEMEWIDPKFLNSNEQLLSISKS